MVRIWNVRAHTHYYQVSPNSDECWLMFWPSLPWVSISMLMRAEVFHQSFRCPQHFNTSKVHLTPPSAHSSAIFFSSPGPFDLLDHHAAHTPSLFLPPSLLSFCIYHCPLCSCPPSLQFGAHCWDSHPVQGAFLLSSEDGVGSTERHYYDGTQTDGQCGHTENHSSVKGQGSLCRNGCMGDMRSHPKCT